MRVVSQRLQFAFSQMVKLSNYSDKFQHVAKLELDNPSKKNALSVDLLNQVQSHSVSSIRPSSRSTSSRN